MWHCSIVLLYKIRCNQMHAIYDDLPCRAVCAIRVTHGAVTEFLSTAGLWISTLYHDMAMAQDGMAGFKSRTMQCLFIALLLLFFLILFYFSHYGLVLWGWGLWTDRMSITLSQTCITDLFKTIITIIIKICKITLSKKIESISINNYYGSILTNGEWSGFHFIYNTKWWRG